MFQLEISNANELKILYFLTPAFQQFEVVDQQTTNSSPTTNLPLIQYKNKNKKQMEYIDDNDLKVLEKHGLTLRYEEKQRTSNSIHSESKTATESEQSGPGVGVSALIRTNRTRGSGNAKGPGDDPRRAGGHGGGYKCIRWYIIV